MLFNINIEINTINLEFIKINKLIIKFDGINSQKIDKSHFIIYKITKNLFLS